MVDLNPDVLAAFIGGQLEIQNQDEDYICRGEIKNAEVKCGVLVIDFSWVAEGEGFPPRGWHAGRNLHYEASLDIFAGGLVGPSSEGGGSRFTMMSMFIGETVTFFPPDGSKLDPATVKGLKL